MRTAAQQTARLAWALPAALLIGSAAHADTGPAADAADPMAGVWRVAYRCPTNSLYVSLRMLGVDAPYAEIERRLRIGEAGASLVEVRDAARSFGPNAAVVKLTPDDLPTTRLPIIAHCDCEEQQGVTGHYVVVVRADSDSVEFVDGTTGMVESVTPSRFHKMWTGYAVVFEPARPWWWRALFPAAIVLGCASLLVAGVRFGSGWYGRVSAGPATGPTGGGAREAVK